MADGESLSVEDAALVQLEQELFSKQPGYCRGHTWSQFDWSCMAAHSDQKVLDYLCQKRFREEEKVKCQLLHNTDRCCPDAYQIQLNLGNRQVPLCYCFGSTCKQYRLASQFSGCIPALDGRYKTCHACKKITPAQSTRNNNIADEGIGGFAMPAPTPAPADAVASALPASLLPALPALPPAQPSDVPAAEWIQLGAASPYAFPSLAVRGIVKAAYFVGRLVSWSDAKLKCNVQKMDDGDLLSRFRELKPVTYKIVATGQQELGFIAQEVQQQFPEVVERLCQDGDHEVLGINYPQMVTVVTQAVQILLQRFDKLEAQSTQEEQELKSLILDLNQRLARMKDGGTSDDHANEWVKWEGFVVVEARKQGLALDHSAHEPGLEYPCDAQTANEIANDNMAAFVAADLDAKDQTEQREPFERTGQPPKARTEQLKQQYRANFPKLPPDDTDPKPAAGPQLAAPSLDELATDKRYNILVAGDRKQGKSHACVSLFEDWQEQAHAAVLPNTAEVTPYREFSRQNGNLTLHGRVYDSAGFGTTLSHVDDSGPVVKHIMDGLESYYQRDTAVERVASDWQADERVHVLLYFIKPMSITPVDLNFLEQVHNHTNVVLVVSKADSMTSEETQQFVQEVVQVTEERGINRFMLLADAPNVFPVVTRNGRYCHGNVEVENPDHSSFPLLRHLVMTEQLRRLLESTDRLYECYRRERMQQAARQAGNHHQRRREQRRIACTGVGVVFLLLTSLLLCWGSTPPDLKLEPELFLTVPTKPLPVGHKGMALFAGLDVIKMSARLVQVSDAEVQLAVQHGKLMPTGCATLLEQCALEPQMCNLDHCNSTPLTRRGRPDDLQVWTQQLWYEHTGIVPAGATEDLVNLTFTVHQGTARAFGQEHSIGAHFTTIQIPIQLCAAADAGNSKMHGPGLEEGPGLSQAEVSVDCFDGTAERKLVGGDTVRIEITATDSGTMTSVSAVDHGNGSYTAAFIRPAAPYSIRVWVNGQQVAGNHTVQVTASKAEQLQVQLVEQVNASASKVEQLRAQLAKQVEQQQLLDENMAMANAQAKKLREDGQHCSMQLGTTQAQATACTEAAAKCEAKLQQEEGNGRQCQGRLSDTKKQLDEFENDIVQCRIADKTKSDQIQHLEADVANQQRSTKLAEDQLKQEREHHDQSRAELAQLHTRRANNSPPFVEPFDPLVHGYISDGQVLITSPVFHDVDGDDLQHSWQPVPGNDLSFTVNSDFSLSVPLGQVAPGRYDWLCSAEDPFNGSASASIQLDVRMHRSQPPVVLPTPTTTVFFGTTEVTLEPLQTTDPDGDVLTYKWQQTQGPPLKIIGGQESSALRVSVDGAQEGDYEFQLTVSDTAQLNTSATFQLEVVGNAMIGIDLGTTYTAVALAQQDGTVQVFQAEETRDDMPSVISFGKDGLLIGMAAEESQSRIYAAKRIIGQRSDSAQVQEQKRTVSYTIDADREFPRISVDKPQGWLSRVTPQWLRGMTGEETTMLLSPEEISALVLSKAKAVAEAHLGRTIRNAVITVPAAFNDAQRKATRDAATIAGLGVALMLPEPTAAALAYLMAKKLDPRKTHYVLVVDFGGGTLDVSLLSVRGTHFKVQAISGDLQLGGEDLDTSIMQHFVELLRVQESFDALAEPATMARLKIAAKKVKEDLSSSSSAIAAVQSDAGHWMQLQITRDTFERINTDAFNRLLVPVWRVLNDTGYLASDMNHVLCVGGTCNIPKVRQMLQEFFPDSVVPDLEKEINLSPTLAVVKGAALAATFLQGDRALLPMEATALSIGTAVLQRAWGKDCPLHDTGSQLQEVRMVAGPKCAVLSHQPSDLMVLVRITSPQNSTSPPLNQVTTGTGTDFVLFLDVSGSMGQGSKMQSMIQAVLGILEQLSVTDRLCIFTFDHAVYDLVPFTFMSGAQPDAVKESVKRLVPQGGTEIAGALEHGMLSAARRAQEDRDLVMLLLTDGHSQSGWSSTNEHDFQQSMLNLKASSNVVLHTVGFGVIGRSNTLNGELLRHLAEVGGGTYFWGEDGASVSTMMLKAVESSTQVIGQQVRLVVEPKGGYQLHAVKYPEHVTIATSGGTPYLDLPDLGSASEKLLMLHFHAASADHKVHADSEEVARLNLEFKIRGGPKQHLEQLVKVKRSSEAIQGDCVEPNRDMESAVCKVRGALLMQEAARDSEKYAEAQEQLAKCGVVMSKCAAENADCVHALGAQLEHGRLEGEEGKEGTDASCFRNYTQVLIRRNSLYPTVKTREFPTVNDNQAEAVIKLFEGEEEDPALNHFLGEFRVSGIPPRPAGAILIELNVKLDGDGILSVDASFKDKDVKGTAASLKLAVAANDGRLSQDLIVEARQIHASFLGHELPASKKWLHSFANKL